MQRDCLVLRLQAVPGIAAGLVHALVTALDPDPTRRFPSASAMMDALQRI
jgi:hypothetical protein